MKFKSLIADTRFYALTLYHIEEDTEEMTLVDFGLASLREKGLEYWADVLDATVEDFDYNEGLKAGVVWVSGVAAERVEEFQAAHAGYNVSSTDWDIWFTMLDDEMFPEIIIDDALDIEDDEIRFTFEDGTEYLFVPDSDSEPEEMN